MKMLLYIHKSSTGSLSISCAVYRKVLIAMKKQRNTVQENDSDGVLSSVHTSTDVLACLPDEALDVLIESDETAAVLMHDNENADNNSSDEQQTSEVLGTQRNPQEMVIENSKQPRVLSDDIFKQIVSSLKIHPKASVSKLYAIAKSGTYNQRAISSLANETFFGELSDMDVTRLGCPKAINIPRLMSTVAETQHYRCDPSDRYLDCHFTIISISFVTRQ